MNIERETFKNLEKIGIYKIINLTTGKVYIGSTKKSFISRFSTHYQKLKNNNHKGYPHLQSSVNKYGIENFEFSIIEICKEDDCLEREKYWIKTFDATNRKKGYNIKKDPNSSPMSEKEVRDKVGKIIKKLYRSGKMKPNSTIFKRGAIPWNKGKRYRSTDHLKVPKLNKGSRENFKKTMRERQLPIEVYTVSGEKVGVWRYIKDIVELSKDENSIISKSMILKNPNGRNGYSPTRLFNVNIQKSCNYGKIYKGLIFKYSNKANVKSDKLLENPEMDNQQPITNLNG